MEVDPYENDISAEEKAEIQGTRFPRKNADSCRPRCTEEKKTEGKKESYRIRITRVVLFYKEAGVVRCHVEDDADIAMEL